MKNRTNTAVGRWIVTHARGREGLAMTVARENGHPTLIRLTRRALTRKRRGMRHQKRATRTAAFAARERHRRSLGHPPVRHADVAAAALAASRLDGANRAGKSRLTHEAVRVAIAGAQHAAHLAQHTQHVALYGPHGRYSALEAS